MWCLSFWRLGDLTQYNFFPVQFIDFQIVLMKNDLMRLGYDCGVILIVSECSKPQPIVSGATPWTRHLECIHEEESQL